LAPGAKPKPNTTVTITLVEQPDGTWKVLTYDCAAAVSHQSGVSGTDVRDAVRRLVPAAQIGVAPPGGATLVNIQTLLWVDTPVDRSLGTVQLLGQAVTVEIHLDRVSWTFGDGSSESSATPGKPYRRSEPCSTAQCPGYYGHVYRTTGSRRITATTTWTGRYRVGTGGWLAIPGSVTGPATSTQVIVREARGVLVPNPGDH
jgi:hypothetical protein